MSGLQIKYSKEIARELNKIAVCLPGDPINVGDIITFPFGRRGLINRPAPWGTFRRISRLADLGINIDEPNFSSDSIPYRFSSRNSVSVHFEANATGDLGNVNFPSTNGNLNVNFSAEGSVFFVAVGCQKQELRNLLLIENAVNANKGSMVWDDTFLVVSVTTAERAFIMQANSSNAQLSLAGDVKGLQTSSGVNISASSNIKIIRERESAFIMDWAPNITVFMDVMRFKRETFEKSKSPGDSEIPGDSDKLILESVDAKGFLQ